MAQIRAQCAGELDERRPEAMERLQHDRVPGREQLHDPVVDDLVADGCADTARTGEARGVDDRAVLRDSNERRAEPSGREDLVRRIEREEVAEALAELTAPGEQR